MGTTKKKIEPVTEQGEVAVIAGKPFPLAVAEKRKRLEKRIAGATSTSHKKKLEKERQKLVKQQAELLSFDEKLRYYADRRISLDLDDGVKVNYGKFGDLLPEVKAVTGEKKA